MAKITMRNIQQGAVVGVSYRDHIPDRCQFLGFTNHVKKYGERPVYKCWADLADDYGFKTFADQEADQGQREYGLNNYAVFRDLNQGGGVGDFGVFTAYLFNNRWCIGSSADPLSLTEDPLNTRRTHRVAGADGVLRPI